MKNITWKIGDTVRHKKFTEQMIITDLFNTEFGTVYGYNTYIENYATLENKDKTVKADVLLNELWPVEMTEEECLDRFFKTSFIDTGFKNINEAITYYQNVTGDKVLNVNYDTESKSVTLITKKFGINVLDKKKNI